jgi:hypothetical protein
MRRITIFATLVLLSMAALSGAIDNRNQTLAADYSCHNTSTCPGFAQYTGDKYAETGTCAITCYKEAGQPAGLIVANGSANCAPPSGGAGGGGGGGGGGYFFEATYCYDNWWWDSNCSDPYDPYKPPYIN